MAQSGAQSGRAFAEQLRANALSPPVMHFVEWSDFWSMGDLFLWAFTPPGGPAPMVVHGDRFELYAYSLPDDGRLARHLSLGAPQGFPEANWFTARLREAIEACDQLVERAVLVVLRHVVGGSVLDEDISASLDRLPDWLARDEE